MYPLAITSNFLPALFPSTLRNYESTFCLWICLFQTFHTNGIRQYVTFFCLVSSGTMFHIYCSMNQYFISFYCQIIFCCMAYHILFIHSPVDRNLGCFHFLPIMNNAAVKTHVQFFLCGHTFLIFLGIYN